MYATAADLEAEVGADRLTALTDRDGDGAADPEAAAKALKQASDEIDAYLAGRYDLPLEAGRAAILKQSAMDIAIYRLAGSTDSALLTEDRRKRFDDAIRFLKGISKGEISIGAPGRAPKPSPPAQVDSGPRRFSRTAMGLPG